MNHTPSRIPAEWEPHDAVWLAWPSHRELWDDLLSPAQREFVALCQAIADPAIDGTLRGERLNILARTADDAAAAQEALGTLAVTVHRAAYGDIWLRDTAPIFAQGRGLLAHRFRFNGWGGKYVLDGDQDVAPFVAAAATAARLDHRFVTEGGALEFDGEGTLLTTRACLLNPNRNALGESDVEDVLRDTLGLERVLWLDDGLLNDHTDGHIDTLARFVAPGEVVCMVPSGDDDPNRDVLRTIERDLREMTDAAGRRLRVHTVPSPGRIEDADGTVLPASYVNFYIANTTVVVPTYGAASDGAALARLVELFPGRRVV
ncbi:MAG: agmatine deiminase family protein, partial [Myxococcota bacterium]